MNLRIQQDCSNINWDRVAETLKTVGMAYYDGEVHRQAFENSHSVLFVFDEDELIGFGRAISDGTYQAALYDIAVLPKYQGQGLGKMIVEGIIRRNPQCSYILYAAVGKESFYRKMNFRKMKTGMALFSNAEEMEKRGFTE